MNSIAAPEDSLPEAFPGVSLPSEQKKQSEELEQVAAATKTKSSHENDYEEQCHEQYLYSPNKNNCKALSVAGYLVLLAVAIALPLTLNKRSPNDNAFNGTSTSNETNETAVFDVMEYLEEHFSVDLPSFHDEKTQDLLETYSNIDLRYDAEQLARYLVANEIFDNQAFALHEHCRYTGTTDEDGNPELYCRTPVEGGDSSFSTGDSGTHLSPSYGTNNQEASMDRYDYVKSDGTYLYVAEEGSDEITVLIAGNGNTKVDSTVVVPFTTPNIRMTAFGWTYETGGILGLLLHKNQLIVLLSGRYDREDGALLKIGTRVALYEINNEPNNTTSDLLSLQEVKDIPGAFVDAYYSANGFLRIVTHSVINKWKLLLEPISLEEAFSSESEKEEYVRRATEWSLYKTIPDFVEKLTSELAELNLDQNLSKFWIPQTNSTTMIASDYSDWYYPWQPLRGEFACRITNVHSFDTTVSNWALGYGSTISVPICGYHTNVYAHEEAILLADELHTSPDTVSTALWGIRLEGPIGNGYTNPDNAKLVGLASVHGTIIDSYSLDFYADTRRRPHLDYLRVATIEWDEWWENSTNTLHVFKFDDHRYGNGGLELMAQIQMGKTREEFKSVRFLDTIAYAVTFELTDPFYVIDLSVRDDPKILGELEIPGFSEYLHPIDQGRVIGVGPEADGIGRLTAQAQVSVFDVSDPTNPTLIDRLVLEGWSRIGDDPRAFRHIASKDGNGIAIVPMSRPNAKVYVLSVASTGTLIVDLAIDHSITMPNINHWECDKLPARSFVFEGEELVTFMQTKIIATNLATRKQTIVMGDEKYC